MERRGGSGARAIPAAGKQEEGEAGAGEVAGELAARSRPLSLG